LASAAMLGTATVLVKLIALAKDWMVARRFGAGDELDAYLIAFMIPSFGVAVLGHSFASAFVPTYVRLSEERPADARRLVSGALAAGLVVLLTVALLLAATSGWLLPLVARLRSASAAQSSSCSSARSVYGISRSSPRSSTPTIISRRPHSRRC
jgi:putative peptidoglycan lipid II flippase